LEERHAQSGDKQVEHRVSGAVAQPNNAASAAVQDRNEVKAALPGEDAQ